MRPFRTGIQLFLGQASQCWVSQKLMPVKGANGVSGSVKGIFELAVLTPLLGGGSLVAGNATIAADF